MGKRARLDRERKPRAPPHPSDEVHEDLVLHDAGDLGHPALRHGAPLTRHQDLTYADEGEKESGEKEFPLLIHNLPQE